MTIRWFSDEDRKRMREEKEARRLWHQFEWEWIMTHSREADRAEPLTPERLHVIERLQIRPYPEED